MLSKFNIHELSWLKFEAKDANKKYFMNENEFIFWKFMKWIFEDLLVTLSRCYFYCTEKQKEYSRIFYYRKNVWNIVMTMAIEDLLK
jgi:hypothetical protein